VIGGLAGTVIDWYGGRRRRQLEEIWRDPAGVQERALLRLTAAARDTEFGLAHGFGGIRSVAEYQARVPVRDYGELRPWLERAAAGEESVAWPGRCRDWVKTSGTTAGDKVIPVTPEAFAAHKKGGWDALLRAASLAGGGQTLMGGPMLFLGGSTPLRPLGEGTQVGDLSGLVASRLPWGFRGRYSPGPACAAIPDWEERLDAIAALASTQDIRLLSGMPSWLVILFERVARHAEAGGRRVCSLGQLWPHLRVLIHGGVAFAPYADVSRSGSAAALRGSRSIRRRRASWGCRPSRRAASPSCSTTASSTSSCPSKIWAPRRRDGTRWPRSSWGAPTRW
jgi:hypothetical protein